MTERFDAIVIGAGHNGLVCASLLAKSGKSVLVAEANEQVGGAAITRAFGDEGFSVSACAHLLYQLQPAVLGDLDLRPACAAEELQTIVLDGAGHHVRYAGDRIEGVADEDAEAYRDFQRLMQRFADMLSPHLNKPPPRLGTRHRRDLLSLAKLGFDVRRLGKNDMREFLRMIAINVRDELVERFSAPLLRGGLAVDAVLGTHLGPRSPGTILTYLYRLAGGQGKLSIPAGGMGAVSEALAAKATDLGVTIRTGTPVQRVIVENGRAIGIETESGDRVESLTVISNADPKRTVLNLVGARHFEARFVHRITNIRMRGNAAKLHLALDDLPTIAGFGTADFGQRLLIAPDENYVEKAFNPAKYGEFSPHPVAEVTFPTVHDPSLAPPGRHVMSAVVKYAPYGLKSGWNDASRGEFSEIVLNMLSGYMPNLRERIVARELLTPPDLEADFGLGGGHWHHGELALDQFMFVRPVAGAASEYRGSLDGLFFCGAGAHPGGGVTGAAGRNAARAILARERIRWERR